MKGFSIIIVTWNGLAHLKNFLPSVASTRYENFEIILADNASTDSTVEWVRTYFSGVRIATFDDNYGYTGGNNRAVPFAKKEILLFLNNDVSVDPDWLHGITEVFEKQPNTVAVQPKIRSYKKLEYFDRAGAAGGFLDRFGYPFCRGRILDYLEKDTGQFEEIENITWASGAALAIKKNVFESLGGFDEDFEFHMEEIDLCWRALNAGFDIQYTPKSVIYHLGSGSLPRGSSRKTYYNFRNNLYMLLKNLPFFQLCYILPIRFGLDAIVAWIFLLAGRPHEFMAITKAHVHFIFGFKNMSKKRIGINKKVKVLLPVSIIWKYFIQRKRRYNELF